MHVTHLIVSSSVALVVLLFDFVWCFKYECVHIWRAPFTSIKGVYVFAKYFPLLVHITNICLFAYFKSPFPTELCQKWFLFQHLSTIALQIPFDAVVCLRVFALYSRSPVLGILGIIMVLTDGTSNLLIGFFIFRQANFGPLCSTKPGKLGLIPPLIFQGFHGIIWVLTFRKQQCVKRCLDPTRLADLPFLPIVLRDGSIFLAVLTVSFSLSIPYSALMSLEIHIIYPWGMTLMSVFCCHMVLNLRTKATMEANTEHFELDDPNNIVASLPELPPSRRQFDFVGKPIDLPKRQVSCCPAH